MQVFEIATFLIVFIAALVHGLLGVGFPMLATPLLALTSDVREAVVLLLMPTLSINLVNVIRGGHWRQSIGQFWPLALFGAVGSLLGTQLLVLANPEPFKLLMAAMILIYLNIHKIGIRLNWIGRHVLWASVIFGLVGGILAGTVNVMLPALIIFALEMDLKPLVTVQVFNFCFFLGKLSQAAVLVNHGLLGGPHIIESIPVICIALIALAIGMRFRDRIEAGIYRRWLKRTLAAIAVMLILQYVELM